MKPANLSTVKNDRRRHQMMVQVIEWCARNGMTTLQEIIDASSFSCIEAMRLNSMVRAGGYPEISADTLLKSLTKRASSPEEAAKLREIILRWVSFNVNLSGLTNDQKSEITRRIHEFRMKNQENDQ